MLVTCHQQCYLGQTLVSQKKKKSLPGLQVIFSGKSTLGSELIKDLLAKMSERLSHVQVLSQFAVDLIASIGRSWSQAFRVFS